MRVLFISTILLLSTMLQAQPTITSFAPTSGPVGTTVTITGTNFDTTPVNNIVFFGATMATVSAATATELTVTVPVGATYMPITVLVNGLIAYSAAPFVVTFVESGLINTNSFASKVDYTAGTDPGSVAIGDLDRDGKADLAVVNRNSGTVSVLRNTSTSGTIDATSFASKVDFATGVDPRSVSIGDLDGDGKADLVVGHAYTSKVSVFRNTSTSGTIDATSFAAKEDFTTGFGPFTISIGDLDGDGKADLAVGNIDSNTISVLRNTSTPGTIGANSFASKVDFATGTNPRSVAIGDLDGDGKADLVVANQGSDTVSIFRNTSTPGTIDAGSFASKVDYATTGSLPHTVTIGDLDGDGKPDLVVTNFGSNTVSVFRNTSTSGIIDTTSFASKVDYTTGIYPSPVSIGDLDGDGKADLVVANFGSATVSVFRNTSTSGIIDTNSFATKVDYVAGTKPLLLSIGDLDGDGKPDLVLTNLNSNTVSILRNTIVPPSTETDITAFSFAEQTGPATIDTVNNTIDIEVAFGTDVTSLIPTIALSANATVAPLSGVAQDFSSPVVYTVTAEDSTTTQDWTVTATISNQILISNGSATTCDAIFKDSGGDGDYTNNEDFTFTFSPEVSTDKIMVSFSSFDLENGWDYLFVYDGPTAGSPLIASLSGTSIPADISATGPGGELTFRFTSDGSATRAGWQASISCIPPSTETDITAFSFAEQTGPATIDTVNNTIDIEVVFGTDITSLTPTITLSDNATVSPLSGVARDFSSPVVYTVTAQDGTTTQDWTVTVDQAVLMSDGSATTCDVIFKDSGADGDYTNNEDFTFTFSPEVSTDKIMVSFSSFNLENGWDFLYVYDGPTTGSPLVASLSGTSIPADITAIEPGGELTFRFVSDGSFTYSGWEASITCITPVIIPKATIASFSPISGPVGTEVTITGTDFDPTPANNIVFFGATRATVSAATATELTVTVPVGATYMPITVLVNGLIAYSATPFVVTFVESGLINTNSFASKVDFTAGTEPRSVAIGDLDGDGKADLAVLNKNGTVSVYRNISTSGTIDTGSFASKVDYATTGSLPQTVTIGDLDGDGKPDLVVTNFGSNTVSVFRNTSTSGTIDASSFAAKVDYTTGSYSSSASIGDLDGDGKADLAVVNAIGNSVSVFRNTSTPGNIDASSFAAKVDYTTGLFPYSVTIGDLDGDGKVDLAVGNFDSNTISVFRNTSTPGTIDAGSFAAKVDYTIEINSKSLSLGDLDGDGKVEMVVVNQNSNTVSVLRNTSASGSIDANSFSTKVDYPAGSFPVSVSIADLNGDGKVDLAVANRIGNTLSILRNTSTNGTIDAASFAAKVDYVAGTTPVSLAIGDLDGDGKADLAVANEGDNTVSVFRNLVVPPSTETDITAFSFAEQIVAANIDSVNHTVNIGIAFGVDLTNLVSTFTLSAGATASINGTEQISGSTANDFTSPVTYTITAEDGITSQDWSVTIDIILGIEAGLQAGIKVYPNPVQNQLQVQIDNTIDLQGVTRLVIVGMDGREVYNKTYQNLNSKTLSIDMGQINRGIYLVRFSNNDNVMQYKILKE